MTGNQVGLQRIAEPEAYRWPVHETHCEPGNRRPADADRCQRCGGGLFHQDPQLIRSEKTGFARRDIVEWDEQRWFVDGREIVIPAGRGVVTVPNDGGFVWAESESQSVILEWEKFRRIEP